MSKVKLNPCPYCSPFEHDLEFVEISTRNFEHGIAVECLACGCRSMAADADDGEEIAASLWNDMSVANIACTGLAPAVAPESNQVSGASQ